MKKNLAKKLALGLALTLAVGSVPATDVAAASMPAFKSTSSKTNRKVIEVGQTKKYGTKNVSKYSFYKANVGNKKVATVKLTQKDKYIKVTGVAAGKTQVRGYFKNYKTKEIYKDALLYVEVKAKEAEKEEEKPPVEDEKPVVEEAVKLTSFEATGVKKLVVAFSKAVDTTATKIVVKKGNATPTFTTAWATDGTSVTLNMGSRLTEGTYELTVTGVAEEALTDTVAVKDEEITSIEIGTNLVLVEQSKEEKENKELRKAEVSYKILNQYGERMAAPGDISGVSTFGDVDLDGKAATAKENGIAEVTIASDILAIVGTKGTVTIVDATKGVIGVADVVVSSEATAKTIEVADRLYNTDTEKFVDMARGNDPEDFVLLVRVKDQYDNYMDKRAVVAAKIEHNFVGGTTGVKVKGSNEWQDVTIDGVDYVAIGFEAAGDNDKGKAEVGTFYFTFVNTKSGLLGTANFTVTDSTVVAVASIHAEGAIYDKYDNELAFEVVDTNGNTLTKYADLYDVVEFKDQNDIRWVKQKDGTAKLIYTPNENIKSTDGKHKGKGSAVISYTINPDITTSMSVKTLTVTVNEEKQATEVVGLKSGVSTSFVSGDSILLSLADLVIEDQYSNVMAEKELEKTTVNVEIATKDAITLAQVVDKKDQTKDLTGASITANESVRVLAGTEDNIVTEVVKFTVKGSKAEACEVTFTRVKDALKVSGLSIKSIKGGYVVDASQKVSSPAVTVTEGSIVVTGKVSGKTVTIPADQYVITKNTGVTLKDNDGFKTETATLEVTVDTANGPVVLTKEYKYSNTAPVVASMKAASSTTSVSISADNNGSTTITASAIEGLFEIKDQYGKNDTTKIDNMSSIAYDVTLVGDATTNKKTINHNTTNKVEILKVKPTEKYSVTATIGDITVTREFTVVE